jgi:hypothetical protein
MFNHKALALEGVGFGHRVLAILGTRWFDVQVIVTPPPQTGGSVWYPIEDYLITVRVTTKSGKTYESSYRATDHGLSSILRITAVFNKVIEFTGVINIAITSSVLKVKKIITSVFVK